MGERIFLRLGPNGALGGDELQWTLYRAGDPVSYVRSTKTILVRCIYEKGVVLSPEGNAALNELADRFDAWRADPQTRADVLPQNSSNWR